MTNTPVLQVDGISVTLSGRLVLDHVSFDVREGEFTGLIGSNGVGKTTLLRTILGLQRPDDGRVLVAGTPLSPRSRSLGYVPQKIVVDPDVPMRARDFVALGYGVAILLSAHEMNALLPVMDRIVYLTGGRAASGTTDEVIRSEVLSKLYGHHVDVLKLHGRVLVVAEPGAEAPDIPHHPPVTVT